ncbi:MAG: Ig domain-containing protein [Myxococcota bacterium]
MHGSILRRAAARCFVAGLAATSFVFVACGQGEGSADRAPSMLAQAPGAAASGARGGPPEIDDVSWRPRNPMPGRVIEATADVTDPDGDRTEVTFRWLSDDGRRLGEGPRFDTKGLDEGFVIELIAIASDGANESEAFSVEIELGEQSAAIDFVAIDGPEEPFPGALLEAVVETTDESQPFEILYEWRVGREVVGDDDELDTSDLAPGVPIVLSARLEFDDRTTDPVRSLPYVLSGAGAPRIESEPPTELTGGVFRYQIRVGDPAPGAGVRFVLAEGPDGMTVDASTGMVLWRPTGAQRGRFDIELQALDRWGSGAAQTFSIQVDDPAPPASAR